MRRLKRLLHDWNCMSPKSQFMVLIGAFWILIGWGVLAGTDQIGANPLHQNIPAWVRTAVWVATGAYAIRAAWTREHKDRAIGALQIMPMFRAVSYFISWILSLIPGEPVGDPGGWYRCIIHLGLVMAVSIAAHMPSTFDCRGRRE